MSKCEKLEAVTNICKIICVTSSAVKWIPLILHSPET
jgi:hypothetical protein